MSERGGGVVINFHTQPHASKTEIIGVFGKVYKIRVAALPVAGEANAELVRFLARDFGVSQQSIQVLSEVRSRQKRIFIKGRTFREIEPLFDAHTEQKKL